MLLGKRFEELGTVGPEEWGALFGPFDESGEPIPYDELPLVVAVRNGRPAHAELRRSARPTAPSHAVEASAFPILTAHGSQGAIAIFWPAGAPTATGPGRREGQALGNARLDPRPRAGDDPLRRQHLLRRRHPLRRLAAGARRRHRHPQPRPRARRRADPAAHPPHPPAPRPHPGPRLLRPRLPPADRDRDLGPGLARGLAARPHRPLHLRAALAGRGPRAALRRLLPPLPRRPSGRSARRGSAPPRSPTAARRSATGSTTATPRSPTSPTTSPRSAPTSTRSRRTGSPASRSPESASLLIHDGQYADAEYPDHVGWGHSALAPLARLRPPHRRRAHRPLPPRPAALRRLPRRASAREARRAWAALGGDAGRDRGRRRAGRVRAADARAGPAAPLSLPADAA